MCFGFVCVLLFLSWFAYLKKFTLKSVSSLSSEIIVNLLHPVTILVPLWYIIISLAFFFLSKTLFSGCLQFKGNSRRGQNTCKSRGIRTLLNKPNATGTSYTKRSPNNQCKRFFGTDKVNMVDVLWLDKRTFLTGILPINWKSKKAQTTERATRQACLCKWEDVTYCIVRKNTKALKIKLKSRRKWKEIRQKKF